MGKFKVNGEVDINSYLTAATTFYISSGASTSIIFRNGTTEAARINPSGCLNINSSQTSGDYKLYVGGASRFGGAVNPTAANSYSNGSAALPWYGVSARRFYLYDGTNTGTTYGYLQVSTQGTTSTGGVATMCVGNNVATGTAGNAYGQLLLFSSSTGYAYLRATTGTTTGTTHYLPTSGGTLLNTANYSSYALPLSGGTITGTSGDTPLRLKSADTDCYLQMQDKNGTSLGYYGVNASKQPVFYDTTERVILHSNNYTSYTVTKTGSGASGTWGINISGNAATATTASGVAWGNISSKPTLFYVYGRGDIGASYNIDTMTINGLFEIRASSEVTISGTGSPTNGWYPCLSMYGSNCRMQIAGGNSYGFWIRGRQGPDPTLASHGWLKIQMTQGYGSTLPSGSGYLAGTVFYKT